jgi:NAD(P)H-hydrate epimerase
MTPHPGEAGRLLGCSSREVEQDRFAAAAAIAARYEATVVLKGAGTLVCEPGEDIWVCEGGNPGMGDVLTGIIAALVAQGLAPGLAARAGACVHAAAADMAAADAERGLLAGDLMQPLRRLVNTL